MNIDTKRHIDSARQVLVGVVPNPTSQIEQITNALIYKFMDDMDQSAIKVGGKPSFFVGDLEKYSWTKLMDSRIGNQERMNLYSEALIKFSQAKQLPSLFRNIFKSAFLPYRAPEVLGLFLKEINYFDYSHPEELGNAYEYLLSIMGSQGDAGQFRTPRHIIDFMVEIVDPTKDDKVLDPACGTGGFLISAYKHILEQHNGKDKDGKKNNEKPLTPDQRKKLIENFEGYDIDPGMVRIAQVNMYLHQFKDPKIYNYDTLTMEEKWNEKFDVMLANPPFMSPKGGVKTHSKFSVQSNRSEVLFVDYIMNHLRPKGRAGIIVPEGIIFQSATAHKKLRENLVKDGLCAVISLPSGVFNPYAGVKTSILIFDNEIAKNKKEILFLKIENDGFNLGAQRRPIDKNDIPEAIEIFKKWKSGKKLESKIALYVERKKILESEDFNLSGDRYREVKDYSNTKWPMVKIEELEKDKKIELLKGQGLSKSDLIENGENKCIHYGEIYTLYNPIIKNIFSTTNFNGKIKSLKGDVLVPATTTADAMGIAVARSLNENNVIIGGDINVIRTKNKHILSDYLALLISNPPLKVELSKYVKGANILHLSNSDLRRLSFPLPSLEIQEQIVAELDGYQKIIDGARQISENWKPKIDIDLNYKEVFLGDSKVFQIIDGDRGVNYPKKEDFKSEGYCLFLNTSNVRRGTFNFSNCDFITKEKDKILRKGKLDKYDVVLTTRGTIGNTAYYSEDISFDNIRINSGMVLLRSNLEKILPRFLLLFLNSIKFNEQVNNFISGSAQPQLPIGILNKIKIPVPPLEIQKQIVEKIEKEIELVESSKKLIEIYEQKTKEVISKLWEE